MKRLIKGLLAMTTLLLSSCGNNTIVSKKVCNKFTILEDLQVECELYTGKWIGFIDKWIVDVKTSSHYWYEMSNGEHYLKVGTYK